MLTQDALHKPPVERRAERRRACLLRGDLVQAGGRCEPVAVLDLNAQGARVAMRRALLLPTRLILRLTLLEGPVTYEAQLLWRRGLEAGFELSGRYESPSASH